MGGNQRRFQVCQEVEESERQIVQVPNLGRAETRKARRQEESSRSRTRSRTRVGSSSRRERWQRLSI